MLILGIDPGSKVTGFGFVRLNRSISVVDFGQIKPKQSLKYGQKLAFISDGIGELIQQFQPDQIAIESQFVKKNVKAALNLGMVKGVIMAVAAKAGIDLFEYAPRKIKKAVCQGNASKQSIQKMLQLLLALEELPTPEDAADALAIAYTHAKNLPSILL